MNFREYVQNAIRTESKFNVISDKHSIKAINDSLFHSVLWIQTEMWEIFEAVFIKWKNKEIDVVNLKEELWDVMWYIAIACNQLDLYDFEFGKQYLDGKDFDNINDFLFYMNDISINLLDWMKKSLFYVKEYDISKLETQIISMLWYMTNLVKFIDWDLERICTINIEKLRARYPEKFTTDYAVNRDLDKERSILEQ